MGVANWADILNHESMRGSMSLFQFDIEQSRGTRKGTMEDPFIIAGIAVRMREVPRQMDHVWLGRLKFKGQSIPYQPFGFEYKLGFHETTAVFIPTYRKPYMGQKGLLEFTMVGMRGGKKVDAWTHTASAVFKFEYMDGTSEWRPPKRKETILNDTLFALMEEESDDRTQFTFALDHSRRKRKTLYILNIWKDGYPVRITVPNLFYESLKNFNLVKEYELQWEPDSQAEWKAKLNKWVWGKRREYLDMKWEDFVMKMRDGDFRYYQFHPAGKMEVVSYANFIDMRDRIKYWDDTYGKLFS